MNHFDPLTYSIYADGELPPAEAAAVREHLAACAECARLVAGLERENRLLRAALAEEPLPAALRERVLAGLRLRGSGLGQAMVYAAGILLGIFAGVYYLGALLQTVSLFEPLTWFDMAPRGSWIDWLIRASFFMYEEGWTMLLNSSERLAGVAAGTVALLAALPWLRRRWQGLLSATLAALLLLAIFAAPASAVEFRHTRGGSVRVAKGEVIRGTLVAAGQSVLIDGTVEGDLVAAGDRVEVRGDVKGDIFAAGRTLLVYGNVANNAILAGHSLTLEGAVGRNVYAAGERIELDSQSRVAQAVFAAGAHGFVDGQIGDALTAAMSHLQVSGVIGKDLRFHGNQFTLLDTAQVGGDLITRTHRPAHIDPGAKVSGKKITELIQRRSRFLTARYYFRELIWLLGFFVVGVLLLKLFPRFFEGASAAVQSVWRSLGLGLAVLAGVPVAAIVVAVTLVGLPLALLSAAGYLAALYLAKIFVAAWLGRYLLKPPAEAGYGSVAALLLGLFVLSVVAWVPYLGGLVRFVVLLAGLGAFAWQLYQQMQPSAA